MNRTTIIAWISVINLFWVVTLSSQDPCATYEAKIGFPTRTNLDFADAKLLFDEYSSLDCADLLIAYNFIGYAHYDQSNLGQAKEYLIKGEDEFYINETRPEQFALNQMYTALILIIEKDYESALYHLDKAETFAENAADKYIIGSIYQNRGLLHLEMEDLTKSEEYYNKAIESKGLDPLAMGYVYQNLAYLNLKKGKLTQSEDLISKTKTLWNDLGNHKGKYMLSFCESELFIEKKQFAKALKSLENGRINYDQKTKLLLGKNYLIEAAIQDSLGNKEAKLTALQNAILNGEELSEEQLKQTISSLTELQEDSKTNLILSELVSKLKLQNTNQKKITVIRNKIMDKETAEDESLIKTQLIYLFILLGLLFLFAYLFFKINNQKSDIQRLNQKLETSNVKIQKQLKEVEQKNKALEQFAYVASHDLKSPLRTISSFAGLMKDQNLSEEANQYLDIITSSSKNMGNLITELLSYSTLDQNLEKTHVNLNQLINDTTNGIKSQLDESQASISIDKDCDCMITCDYTLFSTVIQNLIVNAIMYCKDDQPPTIDITCKTAGNQQIITVSDNGIGIPQAQQDSIFEMFKRLKIKKTDGTGIGLASCKKIIELHGGNISVDSTEGIGSVFIIELPVS